MGVKTMEPDYKPHEIEKKWQEKWNESQIFQAEPDKREKFSGRNACGHSDLGNQTGTAGSHSSAFRHS